MNKLLKVLGALLLCASGAASALNVSYKAIDLADNVVGEDLWEYRYVFSGRTFQEFETVEISFDPQRYSNLSAPSDIGPWTILITQPDASLPADGLFEAIASIAPIASPTGELAIQFVWLGGDAQPGSQIFRLLNEEVEEIARGRTRAEGAPVPEPESIFLLMAVGTALLGVGRRRRERQRL